jgi:hypothetical protein
MPFPSYPIDGASGGGISGDRGPTVVPAPDAPSPEISPRHRRRTFTAGQAAHPRRNRPDRRRRGDRRHPASRGSLSGMCRARGLAGNRDAPADPPSRATRTTPPASEAGTGVDRTRGKGGTRPTARTPLRRQGRVCPCEGGGHREYTKPELLAERPNEVWSWDIAKLKGPAKWS